MKASLEAYVDALVQLGNGLPRFDRYEGLFQDSPEVWRLRAPIYEDILTINPKALEVIHQHRSLT